MTRVRALPRRTFLRGAGGIALALPALEIMRSSPSARAGGGGSSVARYVNSYVGVSSGRSHYIDDTCCTELLQSDRITPDAEGPDYDLKQGLKPLGADPWFNERNPGFGGAQPAYDVQKHVSIVSGLKVPWATAGGSVPPGGRDVAFHGSSVLPQLCGHRRATVPTVDQLVAEVAGEQTTLAYRVEATDYYNGNTNHSARSMSFKRDRDGNVFTVEPVVDPGLAWQSLYMGFVPPDPAEAAKAAFERQIRLSVLDRVRDNAQRLSTRLGSADRIRMEQHFDEVRALEDRISQIAPPTTPLCDMLPDPGSSWPVGEPGGTQSGSDTASWSNEELRAEILVDLIHMAFVCNMSRVATLMFEHWGSAINVYPMIGIVTDLHSTSHFGNPGPGVSGQGDAIAWHMRHFARLVRKLADTPDEDGIALIDRTILTLLFEGGYGYDPEGNDSGAHSTENMVVVVAGGSGLGLTPGRHIRGNEQHPASVLLACAQACGVTEPLGDITAAFEGL